MKRFLLTIFAGVTLMAGLPACKRDQAPEELKDIWEKDTVLVVLKKTIWRVEKVYKQNGNEQVDIEDVPGFSNPLYTIRKKILLGFQGPGIVMWESTPMTGNEKFRAGAETYEFSDRSVRPTNMTFDWDDAQQTIVARSAGTSGILNVPVGITATLDKASIVSYRSYVEEEKAVKPSNLTFKVVENGVSFLYHLKPVWYYENAPSGTNNYRYVVFP